MRSRSKLYAKPESEFSEQAIRLLEVFGYFGPCYDVIITSSITRHLIGSSTHQKKQLEITLNKIPIQSSKNFVRFVSQVILRL